MPANSFVGGTDAAAAAGAPSAAAPSKTAARGGYASWARTPSSSAVEVALPQLAARASEAGVMHGEALDGGQRVGHQAPLVVLVRRKAPPGDDLCAWVGGWYDTQGTTGTATSCEHEHRSPHVRPPDRLGAVHSRNR